jgi:hypothetical protein
MREIKKPQCLNLTSHQEKNPRRNLFEKKKKLNPNR